MSHRFHLTHTNTLENVGNILQAFYCISNRERLCLSISNVTWKSSSSFRSCLLTHSCITCAISTNFTLIQPNEKMTYLRTLRLCTHTPYIFQSRFLRNTLNQCVSTSKLWNFSNSSRSSVEIWSSRRTQRRSHVFHRTRENKINDFSEIKSGIIITKWILFHLSECEWN